MTMTRRGLAKGAAAALVAAPVLAAASARVPTPIGGKVLLCSTPVAMPFRITLAEGHFELLPILRGAV